MDIEEFPDSSVTTPDYISHGSAEQKPISGTAMRKAWLKVTLIWDIYSAGTTILLKIARVIHYIQEILSWKCILVVSCIAVSLDPLFLYIPIIDENKCLGIDRTLKIVTLVLRSLVDITFMTHIIGLVSDWKFSDEPQRHVSYFDSHFEPASGLLWKLKFLKQAIAKRMPWLSGTVMIHFLAVLPIPQVIAAFWYFFAIHREISCWHQACDKSAGCLATYACGGSSTSMNITFQNELCPIFPPNTTLFDFGIFLDILQSVVPKTYLDNSSLEPNNRIGENLRPILGDIYSRLAPGFKAITCVHCDSECNAAAHCIASHAMDDATDSSSWYGLDAAPSWLITALTKDSPHLYT
ncbi:hypothetical protein ACLB2K_058569 [Fragaria x ananassa]